jgi:hypothetical protein
MMPIWQWAITTIAVLAFLCAAPGLAALWGWLLHVMLKYRYEHFALAFWVAIKFRRLTPKGIQRMAEWAINEYERRQPARDQRAEKGDSRWD